MVGSVITHKKVSTVANSTNTLLVRPSDWNDDHNIDLELLTDAILSVTAVLSSGHATPFLCPAANGLSVYTIYNTSGAPYAFDLPASPADNQIVQVLDAGLTAAAHQITINGEGNTICAYGATGSSAGIASNGGSLSLAWDGVQWTQNG